MKISEFPDSAPVFDIFAPFVSKLFFPARRSKSVPRAEFAIYRFLLADRVKTVFSGAAPENNSARHFFDISIFLRAENSIIDPLRAPAVCGSCKQTQIDNTNDPNNSKSLNFN